MFCAFFNMLQNIAQLLSLIIQNKKRKKCAMIIGTVLAKGAMAMRDFERCENTPIAGARI
jgi:hypothetical protein